MSENREITLDEGQVAFWVASYARSVVRQIIKDGRPNPDDFISLCASIQELDGKTLTITDDSDPCNFAVRASELYDLMKEREGSK